jgi:hypothetical protein
LSDCAPHGEHAANAHQYCARELPKKVVPIDKAFDVKTAPCHRHYKGTENDAADQRDPEIALHPGENHDTLQTIAKRSDESETRWRHRVEVVAGQRPREVPPAVTSNPIVTLWRYCAAMSKLRCKHNAARHRHAERNDPAQRIC